MSQVKNKKLTNIDREDFVVAVMADVPQKNYSEIVRSAVLAASIEALPPKVKALAKDKDLRHYLNTVSCTLKDTPNGWITVTAYGGDSSAASKLANEVAAPFYPEWNAQTERRTELHVRIKAIAAAANTTKQLAERVPEFARYLPKEGATTANLPALANTVAEFVKAGWPANKEIQS